MLRWWVLFGFFSIFIVLPSCSKIEQALQTTSEKYPEAYGVYVHLGSEWVELREPLPTVGFDVAPEVKFLVHDKRLSMQTDGGFKLVGEHFVRNVISQDPSGSNRKEEPINSWQSTAGEAIATQLLPVNGMPEMVIIRPRTLLAQGVYQVTALGKIREAISVGAPGIFREPGRNAHCVDIVKQLGFGFLPMGIADTTVPCTETPSAQASQAEPSPQTDGPLPPPLNTPWFGIWKTQDGRKTIEISASKLKVSADQGSDKAQQFELALTPDRDVGEGQFGDARRSTTPADILSRYETTLIEFQKDPSDFLISDPGRSRQAIASISPGRYAVLNGYLGGDCQVWDWILDNNKLLEVSGCKYGLQIQLLERVREL